MRDPKRKPSTTFIFLIVFVFNLIAGYLLVFKFGYIADEAVIRTGQAIDLINGYNRGGQGLVCSIWLPPFPTLIQIPLVFFKFHLHNLFLNNILSSIFAAGSGVFLNMLFKRCEVDRVYRFLLLVFFYLNPLTLFQSANGTSQMMFVLFLVASFYYLLAWLKEKGLRDFLLMTLNTSLLCLIRIEGFFYAIAILAVIIIVSFYQRYKVLQKEGLLLLYLAPIVYLISLWFLFNWLIMGNAVYFLRGIFFEKRQLINPLHNLAIVLAFLLILLAKFLYLQKRNSFYALKKYILLIGLIAALFLCHPFCLIKEEINRAAIQEQEITEIEDYIVRYRPDNRILITDFQGYLFRYYSKRVDFLTHCFDFSLKKMPPDDAPVYLLVSRHGVDAILWKYPHIYEQGTEFTILEQGFENWRLFRLITNI